MVVDRLCVCLGVCVVVDRLCVCLGVCGSEKEGGEGDWVCFYGIHYVSSLQTNHALEMESGGDC